MIGKQAVLMRNEWGFCHTPSISNLHHLVNNRAKHSCKNSLAKIPQGQLKSHGKHTSSLAPVCEEAAAHYMLASSLVLQPRSSFSTRQPWCNIPAAMKQPVTRNRQTGRKTALSEELDILLTTDVKPKHMTPLEPQEWDQLVPSHNWFSRWVFLWPLAKIVPTPPWTQTQLLQDDRVYNFMASNPHGPLSILFWKL